MWICVPSKDAQKQHACSLTSILDSWKVGQVGKCPGQAKFEGYLPNGQDGIQIFFEPCRGLRVQRKRFLNSKKYSSSAPSWTSLARPKSVIYYLRERTNIPDLFIWEFPPRDYTVILPELDRPCQTILELCGVLLWAHSRLEGIKEHEMPLLLLLLLWPLRDGVCLKEKKNHKIAPKILQTKRG